MERSEIRERRRSLNALPKLRCASSGLQTKEKREAERRQTCVQPPRPDLLSLSRLRGRVGRGHGAHRRVRSPVGVPPRLLRQRTNADAQLQARLPGTRQDTRSGKLAPTGERRPRAVPRALSAPANGEIKPRSSSSRTRTSIRSRSKVNFSLFILSRIAASRARNSASMTSSASRLARPTK